MDWASEVFFRRVLSIVDDYGRYEANPLLLRSKCYPLQVDAVKQSDINKWLAECQKAGLLILYFGVMAGKTKRFLQIVNFGQQTRTPSKFPSPDDKCSQMIANAHLVVSVSVSGGVSANAPVARDDGDDIDDSKHQAEKLYSEYPRRVAKPKAIKAILGALKKADFATLLSGVLKYKAAVAGKETQYIAHAASWFNAERWLDEDCKPTSDTGGNWKPSKGIKDAMKDMDLLKEAQE